MLEERWLEADPQVGLLPVTVLLRRKGDTLGLSSALPPRLVLLTAAAPSPCVMRGDTDIVHAGGCMLHRPARLCAALLTASFSGLQTFTHKMWSRSQSMGLSR